MINTLLISPDKSFQKNLERTLNDYFPFINIINEIPSVDNAVDLIDSEKPDLLFVEMNKREYRKFKLLEELPPYDFETIMAACVEDYAVEAIKYCVTGYLLRPLQVEELLVAVKNVQEKILLKQENRAYKDLTKHKFERRDATDLLGVPTSKGFKYVTINQIIRCEGFQRYTKIHLIAEKKNIVSSYSIGFYRKFLEQYGFFSPHKSHLINLGYLESYKREGTIFMVDGSTVPVSKGNRNKFLKSIAHL